MDYYEIFSLLSLPLGVLILLILACRALVLWYFRIPDMISRQDELIKVIRNQNAILKRQLDLPETEEEKKATAPPTFTELRYGKSN